MLGSVKRDLQGWNEAQPVGRPGAEPRLRPRETGWVHCRLDQHSSAPPFCDDHATMIAPDGVSGKGAISRSSEPTRTAHAHVRNIIKMPKFEQPPAKLEWEGEDCCLRARSAFEHRIPQPPSPPGFGADRAQLLRVDRAYGSQFFGPTIVGPFCFSRVLLKE